MYPLTVYGHDSITFTFTVDVHCTDQFRLPELGCSTNIENMHNIAINWILAFIVLENGSASSYNGHCMLSDWPIDNVGMTF